MHCFIHSFIGALFHSFFHRCIVSFILSLMHCFIHSFIDALFHSFNGSMHCFSRSFVLSINALFHAFICSINQCIVSFIHLLNHSIQLIHPVFPNHLLMSEANQPFHQPAIQHIREPCISIHSFIHQLIHACR